MRRTKYFWAFALLGLANCAALNPYTMNPSPTLSGDHVVEFASVGKAVSSDIVAEAGSFRKALLDSSGDPPNASLALNYMETGVAVADIYCEQYFRALSVQHADQTAGRGALNIADAATSGILGATGAAADTVSIISVLFSAAEAQYENIDAAYLVSPNISFVERLVTEARQTLYEELVSDGGPKSYAQAERRLIAYHKLCTFNGINRLVDEAIAAGKPVVRSDTIRTSRSRLSSTAARGRLDVLTDELAKPGTVWGYEQAAWLYAFYFLPRTKDDGVVDQIDALFKDVLNLGVGQTSDAYLQSKTNTARSLLLEIDRAAPLEDAANQLVTEARQNKQLKDQAEALVTANCPVNGDATKQSNLDALRPDLVARFGDELADELLSCPAVAGGPAPAANVELPVPGVEEAQDDPVSLLVTVEP